MSDRVPGRETLGALAPGSRAHTAAAAALANASRKGRGETRADIEARLGHPIDVIAVRCPGHASGGRVRQPRVGYAVRFDVASGWFFGATLSAAIEADSAAAFTARANSARSESYLAKQSDGHERDVLYCQECPERFTFANGPRIAAALEGFLAEDRHTVTIAEIRDRY